jgi:hypothetical protein
MNPATFAFEKTCMLKGGLLWLGIPLPITLIRVDAGLS